MKHLPLLIGFAVVLCLSPAFGQRGWSANAQLLWGAPAPVDKLSEGNR
jgi:hypothetical protein